MPRQRRLGRDDRSNAGRLVRRQQFAKSGFGIVSSAEPPARRARGDGQPSDSFPSADLAAACGYDAGAGLGMRPSPCCAAWHA